MVIGKTTLGNRFMVGPQISRLSPWSLSSIHHLCSLFLTLFESYIHELFVDTIASGMSVSLSLQSGCKPRPSGRSLAVSTRKTFFGLSCGYNSEETFCCVSSSLYSCLVEPSVKLSPVSLEAESKGRFASVTRGGGLTVLKVIYIQSN